MRTKNRPIEVLAPAGSMECLKAAILNGAAAVYLGGEMSVSYTHLSYIASD